MEKEYVFRTENLDFCWNKDSLRKVSYRKDGDILLKVDEIFYDIVTDRNECYRVHKNNSWQVKGRGRSENGRSRIEVREPQNCYPQYCIIEVTFIDKNGIEHSHKRMYKLKR